MATLPRADRAGDRVRRRREGARLARDPAGARAPRARPAAAAGRRPRAPAVEEAERWGDEVLQPLARRLAWAALVRDTGSMMGFARRRRPAGPRRARAACRRRSSRRASAAFNGASDPAVRADLINLDFHLDRADRWIETGAAGASRRRRTPPTSRSAPASRCCSRSRTSRRGLEARPCETLAMRWFPEYPGSVPAGVLPREWLEARAPCRRGSAGACRRRTSTAAGWGSEGPAGDGRLRAPAVDVSRAAPSVDAAECVAVDAAARRPPRRSLPSRR